MNERAAFRGQPLLLLGALLVGWTVVRAMVWETPIAQESIARGGAETESPSLPNPVPRSALAMASPDVWGNPGPADVLAPILPPQMIADAELAELDAIASEPPLAALQAPELRNSAAAPQVVLTPAPAIAWAPSEPGSRWSADAWLLMRRDATTPFLSGRTSYGRSQAGAVLRYDLARTSPHRPQAYLRASAALAGEREEEVAVGVSVRPVRALPLRFALEGRVGETDRGRRVRPAAYAVTELSPLRLPLGLRAEAYAQGGYVGGAFATPFVDGQAHVGRSLLSVAGVEVSAEAGVWGGAQREASRLDVGPSATVSFDLGRVRGRIAADYRFRVAGNAQPASGPALTVSAGF
jgi:hypothetical protein